MTASSNEFEHTARRDAEVTRRLNQMFADLEVRREQLLGATDLDDAGTDWSEEYW